MHHDKEFFSGFQNISGVQTEAQLVGLEPVSTYSISISAFTKVGNGNQYSNVVKFTTQESGEIQFFDPKMFHFVFNTFPILSVYMKVSLIVHSNGS